MITELLLSQNDDECRVTLNDDGTPHSAVTSYDMAQFKHLLNDHYPPPPGCEWELYLTTAFVTRRAA